MTTKCRTCITLRARIVELEAERSRLLSRPHFGRPAARPARDDEKSQLLAAIRERWGLNNTEIAEALGINPSRLSPSNHAGPEALAKLQELADLGPPAPPPKATERARKRRAVA